MSWGAQRFGKKGEKRTKKPPRYAPYRSALEKRIADAIHDQFKYEPKDAQVPYTIPHTYTPDFVHPDSPHTFFEVKGYFRTSAEAAKYVHIKKAHPEVEIVFIFGNVNKKAHPNCRPRTDGTVLTLWEWCQNNEFLYYEEKHLPPEIVKGIVTAEWIQKERAKRGYENVNRN